jgi:hypothetical protein
MLNSIQWDACAKNRVEAYSKALSLDAIPEPDRRPLLCEFVRNEAEFLAAQDQKLFQAAYEGEFGKSLREQFAAEQKYRDEMQASRDRENFNASMNMFMAGAALGAQSAAIANHTYTPQMGMNTMMVTNMASMNIAITADRENGVRSALSDALAMHFQRVGAAQAEFVIKTSHGIRKIHATSLKELRDGYRGIVQELRAASTVAEPKGGA